MSLERSYDLQITSFVCFAYVQFRDNLQRWDIGTETGCGFGSVRFTGRFTYLLFTKRKGSHQRIWIAARPCIFFEVTSLYLQSFESDVQSVAMTEDSSNVADDKSANFLSTKIKQYKGMLSTFWFVAIRKRDTFVMKLTVLASSSVTWKHVHSPWNELLTYHWCAPL